jgi:tRNA(Ile)-lysidine synthase TilS/MesJ
MNGTPVRDAMAILDEAIGEHQPSHVFALFSGGYDSLCTTYVVAQHPRFMWILTIKFAFQITAGS